MVQAEATFVASRFRDGGVEKWMNRLAAGLLAEGIGCTFLLGENGRPGAGDSIPDDVQVRLAGAKGKKLKTLVLERMNESANREHVFLVFRTADYAPVIRTLRKKGARSSRVFLVTGAFISPRVQRSSSGIIKAWKLRRRLKSVWSLADGLIAVSPEIAEDWRSTGVLPAECIHSPHPPVVGKDVAVLSREDPGHPWLFKDAAPVVLGVGRLSATKRFDMLMQAVAQVKQERPVKCILLGKGEEEQRLKDLARELGLTEDVDFPGYVDNPYSWMRASSLVVLPSSIENFGFSLVESLYLGTPIIAAASPPGPKSIVQATGCGTLVYDETPRGFAEAITNVLTIQNIDNKKLSNSVSYYDIVKSAKKNIELIFKNNTNRK
jgi:glycosyltransferase involved in cell wall biosynthesis